MNIHERRPFDPVGGTETPEHVVKSVSRRRWLWSTMAAAGLAGTAAATWWRWGGRGTDDEVVERGERNATRSIWHDSFPARRDERFAYERPETDRAEAARYTNFYEFSRYKWCWRYVDDFEPEPWTIRVAGLVRNPLRLDLDDFQKLIRDAICERQYRHRCVERWAMAIPWVGVPLARLLKEADPRTEATHVRFVSFHRPDQAPHQRSSPGMPWPYQEGLTIAEAMHDLTFLAFGMYGAPLLKQHGAPIRLVVPWKYGYKSIKSIELIELVDREPSTFWNTLNPEAYPFESNVDPSVPRPWDQSFETMLGTGDRFPTQPWNGYGKWVASLYDGKDVS